MLIVPECLFWGHFIIDSLLLFVRLKPIETGSNRLRSLKDILENPNCVPVCPILLTERNRTTA